MVSWGTAILTSFSTALALVFSFIPKLIGFLVILLVGWLIASALNKAVTLVLRKVGFDRLGNRIGLTRLEQQMGLKMDTAAILGKVVYWFVFLIFLIPAVDTLGLTSVSIILNRIIAFIPNVFVAILILFLGMLAANVVGDIVRGATASARIGNPNVFANIARAAIIVFVALMALEQLSIATSLLNILFTAIVGAAALAFGLAFGLGGRETAQKYLSRTESTVSSAASQVNAQQSPNYVGNTAQAQSNPMYTGQVGSTPTNPTYTGQSTTRNRPPTNR